MIIEPYTATTTALDIIENAFEGIEWLLEDVGVDESMVIDFKDMLIEMRGEIRTLAPNPKISNE